MTIKGRLVGRAKAVLGLSLLLSVLATAIADATVERIEALVVDTSTAATLPEVAGGLATERLVYVGETHTAYADHLIQLEVLRAMATQADGLAIGVEWFQAPFQSVLDDYIAGRIDEAQMLYATEYYTRWRFDYRLYRPIMQFARARGIAVIALNAPAELTGAIGEHGINELPGSLRDALPDSYDVSDLEYEAALREIFGGHGRGSDDDAAFRRFVEVQLTWDESMAQRVAGYLNGHDDARMLVLAGRGHIGGRAGIPNRVERRTGLRGIVVASYSPVGDLFARADYLVLAPTRELPPAGLMQVMLDTRDDGVFVEGFSADSPAETAGMRVGDQVVAIDGTSIRHFADVKLALLDRRSGDEIDVTVSRDALIGRDETLTLRLVLAGDTPAGSLGHGRHGGSGER